MKKITLLFAFFLGMNTLNAQQPELVLTDFDGNTFGDLEFSYWSYPLKDLCRRSSMITSTSILNTW